jgi:protocatechuate 3,4-dioxygenase beta subunit
VGRNYRENVTVNENATAGGNFQEIMMNGAGRSAGRKRTRREILAWLGGAGLAAGCAWRAHAAAPAACIVTPAQTEGPFFLDHQLNRSDIRMDPADGAVRTGSPLVLDLAVWSVGGAGCTPLAGAIVDIWHCDALGVYSGTGAGTAEKKFLRGYQVTDAGGRVAFTTVYPGGYAGRAVHIHFKVRGKYPSGRSYEFTSQFYFDAAVTDRVHARPPYLSRRRVRNADDFGYRESGSRLTLALAERGGGHVGSFDIGLRGA